MSIISLGVAVFFYLLGFTPLPIGEYVLYSIKAFSLLESIILITALIMGIKEKNKAAIILAALLLVMSLKPFLYELYVKLYWLFQ